MFDEREKVIVLADGAGREAARRQAREIASNLGFSPLACEELALVVSELAANLLRHAASGTISLKVVEHEGQLALQVESLDRGPGIVDPGQAIEDGYSSNGGLGYGLGTANRLMDELEIQARPGPGGGTSIVCRRWLRPPLPPAVPCPFSFGVASRAVPSATVNGDSFVIKRWGQAALAAVIDGLGHGPAAHQAAQAARVYLEGHVDRPLAALFKGVERACRGSRGVVMAVMRLDWMPARFTFGSVGNISARLAGSPARFDFVARRGVLGLGAPPPLIANHPWPSGATFVFHSDGIPATWRWHDVAYLAPASAPALARGLLAALASSNDDATVMVIRHDEG